MGQSSSHRRRFNKRRFTCFLLSSLVLRCHEQVDNNNEDFDDYVAPVDDVERKAPEANGAHDE